MAEVLNYEVIDYIENIFKDKHYDTCTYLKGSLKEFIKIHLSQNS